MSRGGARLGAGRAARKLPVAGSVTWRMDESELAGLDASASRRGLEGRERRVQALRQLVLEDGRLPDHGPDRLEADRARGNTRAPLELADAAEAGRGEGNQDSDGCANNDLAAP